MQFDIWAVYVDELPGASAIATSSNLIIKPYTRLNMRFSWKPVKDIELSLVGQNLLYNQRLEFTSESYSQPTEISRSVYAQVSWKTD
jgi:iron complex outermembrane recepter protein